jgi:hypothetical protein
MASVCTLTGKLLDLSGGPLSFVTIEAEMDVPPGHPGALTTDAYVPSLKASASTDKAGNFSLKLLQGATVRVQLPNADYTYPMTVPPKSSAVLVDYLFPRLTLMDFAEASLSGETWSLGDLTFESDDLVEVAAGETLNVAIRLTYSNAEVKFRDPLTVTTSQGTHTAPKAYVLGVTLPAPGDVVVTPDYAVSPVDPDYTALPVMLLPLDGHNVADPDPLTVRFV